MKKAVIYARFSCSNQTEQSIEGQIRVCTEYAKRHDIVIINQFIDRAKSGTNDARPSFQLMMKESEKKEWEIILVYKLDRFSRDKYDSAVHKHNLKQNGIKVISATENIPDSPEAIIYESMLEGFAQYYSAELSQKVKRGLNESYIKGNFTGGFQLYGYDVVDKKNIINKFESEIVIEIFTKYSQGYTANEITKDLNNRGIKTKTNKKFTSKFIYKLLGNEKYIGIAKHQGNIYKDIYPRIIDQDLWNKVETLRNRNQKKHGLVKNVYNYILSRKMYCTRCGCPLTGGYSTSKTGRKYGYYSCRKNISAHKDCLNKSIGKDWIENLVIEKTITVLNNTKIIDLIANKAVELQNNSIKTNVVLNSLIAQKNELIKQYNTLEDAILNKGLTGSRSIDRLNEMSSQLEKLDVSISIEKTKLNTILEKKDIKNFFIKYINDKVLNDKNLQRLLVNTFINRILFFDDKIVIIYNYSGKLIHPIKTSKDIEYIEELAEFEKADFSYVESAEKVPLLPPTT